MTETKRGLRRFRFWFHVDFLYVTWSNPLSRLPRFTGRSKRHRHKSFVNMSVFFVNMSLSWQILYSRTNRSQKPHALSSTFKPCLHLSAQAERITYKHMSLWCVLIRKLKITSVHDQAIKAEWLLRSVHSCWILKGKVFQKTAYITAALKQ